MQTFLGKANNTGHTGNTISVTLPTGKIVKCLALTNITTQNVVVVEDSNKYYVYGQATTINHKRQTRFNKRRGGRNPKKEVTGDAAVIFSQLIFGNYSCHCAATWGYLAGQHTCFSKCAAVGYKSLIECKNDNPVDPNAPGSTGYSTVAYLHRGYWDALNVPNVVRGWPYESELNEAHLLKPRTVDNWQTKDGEVLPGNSAYTVEGFARQTWIPKPIETFYPNPNEVLIGEAADFAIVVSGTSKSYPSAYDPTDWTFPSAADEIQARLAANSGEFIGTSGFPGEFLINNPNATNAEEQPFIWIGLPVTFWTEIELTGLKINNNVWTYGVDPISLIFEYDAIIADDFTYHVDTSSTPAKIIGCNYITSDYLEGPPSPPLTASGPWTLLWNCEIPISTPVPPTTNSGGPPIFGVKYFLIESIKDATEPIPLLISDSGDGAEPYVIYDGEQNVIYALIKAGNHVEYNENSEISGVRGCKVFIWNSQSQQVDTFLFDENFEYQGFVDNPQKERLNNFNLTMKEVNVENACYNYISLPESFHFNNNTEFDATLIDGVFEIDFMQNASHLGSGEFVALNLRKGFEQENSATPGDPPFLELPNVMFTQPISMNMVKYSCFPLGIDPETNVNTCTVGAPELIPLEFNLTNLMESYIANGQAVINLYDLTNTSNPNIKPVSLEAIAPYITEI